MKPIAHLLAPGLPWRETYPEIAARAKAVLSGRSQPMDTAGLVEALYPMATVEGVEGVKARKRLWHILSVLTLYELSNFARRGQPTRTKFPLKGLGGWRYVTVTPWLWADYGSAHSEAKPVCPTCGQYVHDPMKGETNAS